MSITTAEFKTRFPEFASVADDRIQLFIDDSVVILNEPFWDTKYDLGLHYLTAHYLVLGTKSEDGATTGSGPMTGKTVDGVSLSFGLATTDDGTDDYYNQTIYGQRYLSLRKSLGVASASI